MGNQSRAFPAALATGGVTVAAQWLIPRVIGRGADGLITDRPALAREVLEARKNMSSVERRLLELAGLLGVEREIVEQ